MLLREKQPSLSTTNVNIPDNLILRAARSRSGRPQDPCACMVSPQQADPHGRGLGGGSSNAAAVLLALPVLAGGPCPSKNSWKSQRTRQRRAVLPGRRYDRWDRAGNRALRLFPTSRRANLAGFAWCSRRHRPGLRGPLARSLTFTNLSSSINSFQAFVRALDERALREGGECVQRERFRDGRFQAISPSSRRSLGRLREVGAAGQE